MMQTCMIGKDIPKKKKKIGGGGGGWGQGVGEGRGMCMYSVWPKQLQVQTLMKIDGKFVFN